MTEARTDRPLLAIEGLCAGYGRAAVLHEVSLHVDDGEMVALIGSNGAGKSTLLRAIIGLVASTQGSVSYAGEPLVDPRPERLVRRGISLVPEGRLLFGPMTVAENLLLGVQGVARVERKRALTEGLARVHTLFPVLADRSGQAAETLSGGEQQMLAIGRALMSNPRLLLLDEPSLGLAPKVISEIFGVLDGLRALGMTILLVEQDAKLALRHGDRGYVMRTGEIALTGTSDELLANEDVRRIYLGSWHNTRGKTQ